MQPNEFIIKVDAALKEYYKSIFMPTVQESIKKILYDTDANVIPANFDAYISYDNRIGLSFGFEWNTFTNYHADFLYAASSDIELDVKVDYHSATTDMQKESMYAARMSVNTDFLTKILWQHLHQQGLKAAIGQKEIVTPPDVVGIGAVCRHLCKVHVTY